MDTDPPQSPEKPEAPERSVEEQAKQVTLDDIGDYMWKLRTVAHCLIEDEENCYSRDSNDLVNALVMRLLKGEKRSWDNEKYFVNASRVVMRRQLVDWGRERARRVKTKPIREDIDAYATDEALAGPLAEVRALIAKVAKNHPTSMRAVEAFFIEGETLEAIAERENIDVSTAERRRNKGISLLRMYRFVQSKRESKA